MKWLSVLLLCLLGAAWVLAITFVATDVITTRDTVFREVRDAELKADKAEAEVREIEAKIRLKELEEER